MRHRAKVSTFGRKTGPRKALVRGLVYSLVEHGRIKTTLAKAKELRRHVERAVTTGKDGLEDGKSLHATRLLMSRYPNKDAVSKIMKDIAPRMKTRPGGYTRILKIGLRPGDKAEMAFIEFVDHVPTVKAVVEATDDGAETKAAAPKKDRAAVKVAAARKKRLRKIQQDSRREARA